MNISLIANSGIQFHKFDLIIDTREKIIKNMFFYDKKTTSTKNNKYEIEYAYYFANDGFCVTKKDLQREKYLKADGGVKSDINTGRMKKLSIDPADKECYPVSNIEKCLDIYSNKWLPIPYFKKENEGPLAWSRIYIKEDKENNSKTFKKYNVVIAFDTNTDNSITGKYNLPKSSEYKQEFELNRNEDLNINFISENGKWLENYLLEIANTAKGGKLINSNSKRIERFPVTKHIGEYLYLLKYFSNIPDFYQKKQAEYNKKITELRNRNKDNKFTTKINELKKVSDKYDKMIKENTFPFVSFYKSDEDSIDVNLVLDIGNANTFGILFDNPENKEEPNISLIKPIELQDLSNPGNSYEDPFSMNVAVSKEIFGVTVDDNKKIFQWPSLVRLGKEAKSLIGLTKIQTKTEQNTSLSSPKRYLWDTRQSKKRWIDIKNIEFDKVPTPYISGITDKFISSGELKDVFSSSLINKGKENNEGFYSRSSIMTFAYLEIFSQVMSQINSYNYRVAVANGDNEIQKRELKNIIITAPTSIVKGEQVLHRQRAEEAIKVLSSYINNSKIETPVDINIIPNTNDLRRNLSQIEYKKDWNYDEATVSQILYLYSEINEKFLQNSDMFFNLYGKQRKDLEEVIYDDIDYIEAKPVTIATLDIGGGTADLIINTYLNKSGFGTYLKPYPIFWDSFNKAGDDLVQKIVQSIIEVDIKNYALNDIKIEEKEIQKMFDGIFGEASRRGDIGIRTLKKQFIKQITVPIAIKFLDLTGNNSQDKEIKYDEIFENRKNNAKLISRINEYFSETGKIFNFYDIKWSFSADRVNKIIDLHFDKLFRQISILISYFGADFLLLAGKVTTLTQIRNLLVKYYSLPPNRIITLNNYKIGTWYPFADKQTGYLTDGKNTVAVGALISFLSGKSNKFNNFNFDTEYLIKKITSTANYIGKFEKHSKTVKKPFLTPDESRKDISVNIPFVVGYKQLVHDDYPARPIFEYEFNDNYFTKKFEDEINAVNKSITLSDEEKAEKLKYIKEKIKKNKEKFEQQNPFNLEIERDISESKEEIITERISDDEDNDLSLQLLTKKIITLSDKQGYWLDTGEVQIEKLNIED